MIENVLAKVRIGIKDAHFWVIREKSANFLNMSLVGYFVDLSLERLGYVSGLITQVKAQITALEEKKNYLNNQANEGSSKKDARDVNGAAGGKGIVNELQPSTFQYAQAGPNIGQTNFSNLISQFPLNSQPHIAIPPTHNSELNLLNEYLLILHENEGNLLEEESLITKFILAALIDMAKFNAPNLPTPHPRSTNLRTKIQQNLLKILTPIIQTTQFTVETVTDIFSTFKQAFSG